MADKELIVGGGPNGAGKTTFAEEYVAQHGCPYLGADAIAAQISPADPASVPIEAGREFLRQIEEAIAGSESFVVESTLSGRTFQRVLKTAKAAGFQITIHFMWVDSIDTSVVRVQERVSRGGHDVPEDDLYRRFARSLCNFWNLYRPLSDNWSLIYNSTSEPHTVALGDADRIAIRDIDLYAAFQEFIGDEC